jgi:hypothetical protein
MYAHLVVSWPLAFSGLDFIWSTRRTVQWRRAHDLAAPMAGAGRKQQLPAVMELQ